MRSPAAMLILLATAASAGTLDDMSLRSNVESSIRGNAQTAMLHLKIDVVDAVVTPSGRVRDFNQVDDVVQLASRIKGVKDVIRTQLLLEFEGPADAVIAGFVARHVLAIPKFASTGMHVTVSAGVVTLEGSLKNAAWRTELRRLCGAVEGVTGFVDHLETPETPDDRIQKVLDGIFGPRVIPPFPGRIQARVTAGAVTLEGRVPRLCDRDAAIRAAWGINGVRSIDARLELGSGTSIEVVRP